MQLVRGEERDGDGAVLRGLPLQGRRQVQKLTSKYAADNKTLMVKVLQALRGTLGPQ